MPRITHRNSLLSDLTYRLMEDYWAKRPLSSIKVELFDSKVGGKKVATFLGAHILLHYLAEDIYTDGEMDWSDAIRLELSTY